MVELGADKISGAAWKVTNLGDYDRRLERAARRVDEIAREHDTAALVIYEAALTKSGRSVDEVRGLVRSFKEAWEDEEQEPLTIPRVSGIMTVEGDEWFYDDPGIRALTGRLLGQFQHRVAQYNYVDEGEVLRRWANSHDTRLFIRRRIYGTEPVAGVIEGVDLRLMQYLRVAGGGKTLVPSQNIARALVSLGLLDGEDADDYEVLAQAENLALHMDLPEPIAGELLDNLAQDGVTSFPEPPAEAVEPEAEEEPEAGEEEPKPTSEDRADRRAARKKADRGEEPARVQDPQAKEAPGVGEEAGEQEPAAPEGGRGGDAPGTSEDESSR